MRNLGKESPEKISSISDPLLSLSSISLTKNEGGGDKGEKESPSSLSSISTLNNSKLMNDPFIKSSRSEIMEDPERENATTTTTTVTTTTTTTATTAAKTAATKYLLNILNLGSKTGSRNGKRKKENISFGKGKEKRKSLQKDGKREKEKEEEEEWGNHHNCTNFSDLKKDHSLNLKLMNSNIENDPDILPDPTSSFLIVLEDADLWKKFNSVVNEMIITKSGRCLFPILRFQPINLEPKGQYSFAIDILQASPYKYKYRDRKWISGGIKFFAPPTQKKEYYHPDSPQTGFLFLIILIIFIFQ